MSLKRLNQYVNNIENSQPINLSNFYSLLDTFSLDRSNYVADIQATKVKPKGSLYLVTKIDSSLLADLKTLISVVDGDRCLAATQNRSHSAKVNGSFIILRKGYSAPLITMINPKGEYEVSQSQTVLLIENRQNFISIHQTISFLERYTDFKFHSSMDIVFTEGNEVSNSIHQSFLVQYKCIYLFLDLDLGGLLISKNLLMLLPKMEFHFLLPRDIEQRLEKIIEPRDKEYLEKVIAIGRENAFLEPIAKLIKDHRRTLEQENYLYDQ